MPYFRSGSYAQNGKGLVDKSVAPKIDKKSPDYYMKPTQDTQLQTIPTSPNYDQYGQNYIQRQEPNYSYTDKASIPQEYIPQIESIAQDYGLNPSILAALFAQETGGLANPYDPTATSSAGAQGISQVIPYWHYQSAGYPDESQYSNALSDPNFGMSEGARILAEYLMQAGGDYPDALAAYNAGFGNIDAGRPYANEVINRAQVY